MTDILRLFVSFAGGVGLGVFFFGGLWWTIRRAKTAPNPMLLLLGSFIARAVLTLAGFYVLSGGRWEQIVVAILGFLVTRFLTVRQLSFDDGKRNIQRWN
jgi:F1F0 ATPase subunit 2